MSKSNNYINVQFNNRSSNPITADEINSFREMVKNVTDSSNKLFVRLSIKICVVLETIIALYVYDQGISKAEIEITVFSVLVFSPLLACMFSGMWYNNYIDEQCSDFDWGSKANNKISFEKGVCDITDSQYLTLKDMANENKMVMEYVNKISDQKRPPIKAEIYMLKNYLDAYPVYHAKQVLGLT